MSTKRLRTSHSVRFLVPDDAEGAQPPLAGAKSAGCSSGVRVSSCVAAQAFTRPAFLVD